jgi:hypothetical protein
MNRLSDGFAAENAHTRTHTKARTHAHTHTHARTRTRAHARTHARAHTHRWCRAGWRRSTALRSPMSPSATPSLGIHLLYIIYIISYIYLFHIILFYFRGKEGTEYGVEVSYEPLGYSVARYTYYTLLCYVILYYIILY